MAFFREHFRRFARYNRWANQRLYAACGELTEAEYLKPRQAFFGSIHGTLNHILVADRIWMARLEGRESGITALDQQLYGEFAGLKVAREAEDALILALVDGLDERDADRPVGYRNSRGEAHTDPLGLLLGHIFNHQTHHRGQVHDLLKQTAVPPPPLDMIYFVRAPN